jgi:hypothetical protein
VTSDATWSARTTPLPPERAFVVQLRAQADGRGEVFEGRAEHIASGAAAHFASVAELIAFVTQVLSVGAEPPERQDKEEP